MVGDLVVGEPDVDQREDVDLDPPKPLGIGPMQDSDGGAGAVPGNPAVRASASTRLRATSFRKMRWRRQRMVETVSRKALRDFPIVEALP